MALAGSGGSNQFPEQLWEEGGVSGDAQCVEFPAAVQAPEYSVWYWPHK